MPELGAERLKGSASGITNRNAFHDPRTLAPSRSVEADDRTKLEALKQAALSDDWKAAADVYLEIALEAKGTPESAHVETLGPLLSLQDGERMAAAVDALMGVGGASGSVA